MRTYPVLNIQRQHHRLGQDKTYLEQACDAINYYNMFPDVDEDSMKAKQSAIDAMKGLFKNFAKTQEDFDYAKDIIRKRCNAGEDLLSRLQPTTPALTTENPSVPSTDTGYKPPPQPPPGPGTPGPVAPGKPVATGQFRVSPREENPPPVEEQPFTVSSREENPPPYEPPPPYKPLPPAPVETPSAGCWYCAGKGYSYGAKPSSGCEQTSLNRMDCENIASVDREVRGLTAVTPATTPPPVQATTTPGTTSMVPPTTERAPVATGGASACVPPNWWDGRNCRSPMASMPGGFGGVAFGGGASATGGLEAGSGMTAATSFMGTRFPVKNIHRR